MAAAATTAAAASSSSNGAPRAPALTAAGASSQRAAGVVEAATPRSVARANRSTTSSSSPPGPASSTSASASSSSSSSSSAAASASDAGIGVVLDDVPGGMRFTSVRGASFAEDANLRFRLSMEDAHVIIDQYGGDPNTGLFAVYDGHGGDRVARYLRHNLHLAILKELRDKGSRSVEECLKAAFLMADIACARAVTQKSGSTAVVCVVRREAPRPGRTRGKRYVFTANCGDARAVLCHAGRAVRLSKDHKATDSDEVARITSLGGFVREARVMGALAVARSFGDFVFKKYVTCDPYTSTTKIDEHSEFLIVACDGVWDVLSDDEAVAVVRRHCRLEHGTMMTDAETAAALQLSASSALVRESIRKGSTDNVTALVVFL